MKPLEGFTTVEETEDKLVQIQRFGEKGFIRVTGNPNPPPDEHEQVLLKIQSLLLKVEQRILLCKGAGA